MRVDEVVRCHDRDCIQVDLVRHAVPNIEVDTARVRVVMVYETVAPDPTDDLDAGDDALFARTTLQAFRDAGADVSSLRDLADLGVYATPAVKCLKREARIPAVTVRTCSALLEQELALFPDLRAILLMGDVAIASLNAIARRAGEPRVVPAGSTYRIRGGDYRFRGIPVLPSYLQAGPAYFIEASKRAMIAEDIAAALVVASTDRPAAAS